MLGKTHAAVGTASALLIMGGAVAHHPVSLVTGATLGAIGGLMPDIDLNSKHAKAVGFSSVLFLALRGADKNLTSSLAMSTTIAGLIALTVLVVLGLNSNHRGFTHSILALVLFSTAAYAVVGNSSTWFAIGYASHLVIDLFNKKGESLLFPINAKVCFNLCAADGITNKLLESLATVASALLLFGRII